jgi:bile acid-coenzyme A ligase
VTTPQLSLGDRVTQLAEERGDDLAVVCGDVARSWRELDARANRLARALHKRGAAEGSLVTIGLPNSVEFIETCIACWKVGAVPQPVSSRLPALELQAIIDLADPPLVVASGRFEVSRPVLDVPELLADIDDDSPLPSVISPAWKAPTSGGSTGRPKLIVAGQPAVYQQFSTGIWRHSADGVALMPGPMYHNGPFSSAFSGLLFGSSLVLMPRFDAEETLRLIERHAATWVYLVPAMMGRIWRLPEDVRTSYDVTSLQTVWHLAAPCPEWLKRAWIEWLGPEKIWELYGGTEVQAITVITGTEWLTHRGSVGRTHVG